MVIDSYDVRASAQRTYLSVESTSMLIRRAAAVPAGKDQGMQQDTADLSGTLPDLREEERNKEWTKALKAAAAPKVSLYSKNAKSPQELKLSLLEMMFERLTGKKIKLGISMPSIEGNPNSHTPLSSFPAGGQGRTQGLDGWSVEHFSYESESVAYQAQGVVRTADGRQINLDISMNMSREFVSYTNISVQSERRLCDPLVINYAGTAASLTDETFAFDLTMDGNKEQVHFAGAGSGFLALDRNGDGTINDGSELFGPATGSGFDELRRYDADGNGWIDENDDVFSQLRIWSKDKNGNDQLFTLKELDVGAIYLGSVDTQFSLTGSANNTKGIMQSTSFFLHESGGAGLISHIDLSI